LFCKIIYGKAPILCKYAIYALCALLNPFCAGKYKQGPRNQPKCKVSSLPAHLSDTVPESTTSARLSEFNRIRLRGSHPVVSVGFQGHSLQAKVVRFK